MKKEERRFEEFFLKGLFAGRTSASSGSKIKHGVHSHSVLLTPQAPPRALATPASLLWDEFEGPYTRATTFSPLLSPRVSGCGITLWTSSPAPSYPGLCAGLWSGGSAACWETAPARARPSSCSLEAEDQLLFLADSFPAPRAFSRLLLHPPPSLPQIYSSTLGELGRHPASPIGLPSNYTGRSWAGKWGGGREVADRGLGCRGLGAHYLIFHPYPPPGAAGILIPTAPDSSPSSLPSVGRPGADVKGRR